MANEGPHLRFFWTEHGGPPIQASTRKGFGTLLMSSFAQSSMELSDRGLAYKFTVPLDEVLLTDDELLPDVTVSALSGRTQG